MSFHLESVVLYGLDVVTGPYVHCAAPSGLCPGPRSPLPQPAESDGIVGDGERDLLCLASGIELEAGYRSGGALSQSMMDTTRRDFMDSIAASSLASPSRLPLFCSHFDEALGDPSEARYGEDDALPPSSSNPLAALGEVFVPRSEFCQQVLWLYTTESGVLSLYYPEEIAAEHYVRKTLRYTLSFNFRLTHPVVAVGETLSRELIQPYGVILSNIMAELRDAEARHAYMRQQLSEDSKNDLEEQPPLTSRTTLSNGCSQPSEDGESTEDGSASRIRVSFSKRASSYWDSKDVAQNAFILPSSHRNQYWTPLRSVVQSLYEALSELIRGHRTQRDLDDIFRPPRTVQISSSRILQVREVVPLKRAKPIQLSDVPIAVVPSDWLYQQEGLDYVVGHIFHLIDNKRTVADLIFSVSFGLSNRLSEVYERARRMGASEGKIQLSPTSEADTDTNTLLPFTMTKKTLRDPDHHYLTLALPPTWHAFTETVMEALQHLQANHVVKLMRRACHPDDVSYRTTKAYDTMICDEHHPGRREIGRYLLSTAMSSREGGWGCRVRGDVIGSGVYLKCVVRNHSLVLSPLDRLSAPAPTLEQYGMASSLSKEEDRTISFSSEDSAHSTEGEDMTDDEEDDDVTEDEVALASCAAVTALGTFSSTTMMDVQFQMRLSPLFSTQFNHWSDECCRMLVQIGILNDWLSEDCDYE